MRIPEPGRATTVLFVLLAVLACLDPAMAQPIPQNRLTDWTYTGVPGGIPNRTNICATFSPGATASQINSAIATCSSLGGGVVKLEAGTYDITGINVSASNVTLRGAGADQTILRGGNIVNLGSGSTASPGTPIVSGGAKGSRTFTVASTTGLRVNQMIELDRDDDPALVFDLRGGTRDTRQVNLITAIDGSTITVKNPFFIDFSAGNAQIRHTFTNTSFSGIEDLKLDHSTAGSGTNFRFQYCYACWVRGVESYKPAGYHLTIAGTLNLEIRDCFIHDAQTYGSNNAGLQVYGNATYGANSNGAVENNIFDRLFPAVEMQNSSSGFFIGYNYSYGSMAVATDAPVTWTLEDNHGPHDMMNLWEGNIAEMFGADGYFGSSSHGTAVRNYITGYNPNFGTTGNPIRLNRLSYYYSLVGNVLGSDALKPTKYTETLDQCGGSCIAIYRLGYPNIGNASLTDTTGYPVAGMTYPDAKVSSTLLRWGNYDYYNASTRWLASEIPADASVPGDQVIPNSYRYASRPAWLPAIVAWPPIGPDVTGGTGDSSGHVNKIPAQLCWENRKLPGGTFNASACYGRPPAAPTNVIIK